MPRALRRFPVDTVVHAINRGNERRLLFARAADYEDFLDHIDHSLQRVPMRLLAYALMPNHWHLLLWPGTSTELTQFLHYLTSLHARRFRFATQTAGLGHVYQGRYRAFAIDTEVRYLRTLRYMEANPVRAGLVTRAESWRWTSLAERLGGIQRLVPGPVPLPRAEDWAAIVNIVEPTVPYH